MQAIWSQPVAEVVFSNDFASRRARPSRPWATSTRQAWRMGRKHRLLVVPPDPPHFEALASAELACAGRGDATVQDQLEPVGDALPSQVLQHHLTGPVLVRRGQHD